MRTKYDILVIGGGHAGVEAAWAAAGMGATTALITPQPHTIGRMSCNPAIGGLGKGQMVREIDALGGLMALATDRAGIQFRLLNRSKGPAVQAPRAQCDRNGYPLALQQLLTTRRGLDIIDGAVERIDAVELSGSAMACADRRGHSATEMTPSDALLQSVSDVTLTDDQRRIGNGVRLDGSRQGVNGVTFADGPRRRVTGVTLADGRRLTAPCVIVTTGTFLRGLMHCGERKEEGGRIGEPAAVGLSASLAAMGLTLARLKTGTPPRIHRDTVDLSVCDAQPGDDPPVPFSDLTDCLPQRQIQCWITWTNEAVHDAIRANLHRAPMYSGQIESRGPRYCPSIEDKVVRFADKARHQIFLEPEGFDDERLYANGISTSLPPDVQDAMVRGVRGLEEARILQYGYAVEYDFVPTHQTRPTLETKRVEGLFLAGQINGTSGYEEAAAQGLVAGVNAALRAKGGEAAPFVLRRDQAYIGVMIDDLITRPPTEPYRMFTSRAEYRLHLRSDNADQRLTPIGRSLGLVDDTRWHRYEARQAAVADFRKLAGRVNHQGTPLDVLLRRPDITLDEVAAALAGRVDRPLCSGVLGQVLIDAKYSGYVDRQARQIERFQRLESMPIPEGIDYGRMTELRHEARENLMRVGPTTLGQAGRISGISPADITVLWVYLSGRRSAGPA